MSQLQLHLYNEILVAQAIYELWAKKCRKPYFCYFVDNKVWLNTRNIQTARLAAKLDDWNISFYWVVWIFPKKLFCSAARFIWILWNLSRLLRQPIIVWNKQLFTWIIKWSQKIICKLYIKFELSLLCYFVDWERDYPN